MFYWTVWSFNTERKEWFPEVTKTSLTPTKQNTKSSRVLLLLKRINLKLPPTRCLKADTDTAKLIAFVTTTAYCLPANAPIDAVQNDSIHLTKPCWRDLEVTECSNALGRPERKTNPPTMSRWLLHDSVQ